MPGHGCSAGEGLQKIQRGALASQQAARITAQGKKPLIGFDAIPFTDMPFNLYALVELLKNLINPGATADYRGFAADNQGPGLLLLGD